jgi:septal ring factor EnvC (AmiA/AmiB activator)
LPEQPAGKDLLIWKMFFATLYSKPDSAIDVLTMDNLFDGGFCRPNAMMARFLEINKRFEEQNLQINHQANHIAQLNTLLVQHNRQIVQLNSQVTQNCIQIAQIGNQIAVLNANIYTILVHLGIQPAM